MRSILHSIRQFFAELRRRNVYRVAVTYVWKACADSSQNADEWT